jgi:hypothetical protein
MKLVRILCIAGLSSFLINCGGEEVDVGSDDGQVALDDAGPALSQEDLRLAKAIVDTHLAMREIETPRQAIELFDLRDELAFVGADPNEAYDFSPIGRALLPSCITFSGDTINFTNCSAGPASINGHLKINFTTVDMSLTTGITVLGINLAGTMSSLMNLTLSGTPSMSASTGISTSVNSTNVISTEIGITSISISSCGPSLGNLNVSVGLFGLDLNRSIKLPSCT